MPTDSIPAIGRPEIVIADTGPLIHLAQADALPLLHEIGSSVVIVDMVRHEATRDLSKPQAEVMEHWIAEGQKPGSNRPVRLDRTETGRAYGLAVQTDPDFRMKDGGETAIVQWLVEAVDATDLKTIVVYENGKVPAWIGNRNIDADIDVLTTRAFLSLAERRGLIGSAEAVWRKIEDASPTTNPAIAAFSQRRPRSAS